MQNKCDLQIRNRTISEILRKTGQSKTIKDELLRIGISPLTYDGWMSEFKVPNARSLQALAMAGYDVFFILTGRRKP